MTRTCNGPGYRNIGSPNRLRSPPMIAARIAYPYPPDLSGLIDRDKVEEGRRDGVCRLLDEWWVLRADHPPVDCKDAVKEGHPDGVCRLIGEWDRPPQTVYLLPHWADYIRAVQQVTGIPRNNYGTPYLSAGFVVALIIHEHAALVAR